MQSQLLDSHSLINEGNKSQFIEEIKKVREYLIANGNMSAVYFLPIEKELLVSWMANYSKPPENYLDEMGIHMPLAQRVIGAHSPEYDLNFFICRLYGMSVINLRLSHVLDMDYAIKFFCNDQQHATDYEIKITHQQKTVDVNLFKIAHNKVVVENGINNSNPIYKEIMKWIKVSERRDNLMNWNTVVNDDVGSYNLILENSKKPLMVELTFGTTKVTTNKTQKINDNPYGWEDWQKVRNQLTNNPELYKTLYTLNNDISYFDKQVKYNGFFVDKDGKFVKAQYFATNGQPDKTNNGEAQEMFFKFIMSFLDEDKNIKYDFGIESKDVILIRDGDKYKDHLEELITKWDGFDKNLKVNKEQILTLRNLFFEFFTNAYTHGRQKKGSKSLKINQFLNSKSKHYAEHINKQDRKGSTNVKDLRLTKLENALWVMKNCVILFHKHNEKTSMSFSDIINNYLSEFYNYLEDNLDDNTLKRWTNLPTSTLGRLPINKEINDYVVTKVTDMLKESKVTTDSTLKRKHDELFREARSRIPYDTGNGYYYDAENNVWLDHTNVDMGHDILAKLGREANMKTTFIQYYKENRRGNDGIFPTPVEYYQNKLNACVNVLASEHDVDDRKINATISIPLLKEIISMYENNEVTI